MLEKYIYNLFENNKFISFDNLLLTYETYEEPSLLLRYDDINPFLKIIKKDCLNTFLFNLAFSHLNNVKIYALSKLNEKEFDDFFICLTSTDSDRQILEDGFFGLIFM